MNLVKGKICQSTEQTHTWL